MDVEIERPAEPLDHGHRAPTTIRDAAVARASAQEAVHRAKEHRDDRAAQVVVGIDLRALEIEPRAVAVERLLERNHHAREARLDLAERAAASAAGQALLRSIAAAQALRGLGQSTDRVDHPQPSV